MITHACVCGGLIVAPSLEESQPYVEAHGLLPGHQAWRARKEGWYRPYTPRRPTAPVVTCPTEPGASAVEGVS